MTIVNYEKQLVILTKKQEEFILHYNSKLNQIDQHSRALQKIIELITLEIKEPNTKHIHFIKKTIKFIQRKLQPAFFQEFKEEELLKEDQRTTQVLISALDTNKEIIQNHLTELQGYEIAEELALLLEDINQERVSLSDDQNENQSLEQINTILKELIERFVRILIEIQELFNRENNIFKNFEKKLDSADLMNISDNLKPITQLIQEKSTELKDQIIRPILGFLITETLITQRVLEIGERKRITIHTLKRDIKTCTTPQETLTYLDLISEYEELFTNPKKINKFIREEYKKARKKEKKESITSMQTKAKLRQEKGELKELTVEDQLTGILNIRAYNKAMEDGIKVCQRDSNLFLTLFVIDIDDFKRFNDDYGHNIGDEVLQFVAQKIQGILRGGARVYRYGGEEFVVIFEIGTKLEDGLIGAERIRETIEEKSKSKMKKINESGEINTRDRITISGGVSTIQFTKNQIEIDYKDTAINLFKNADDALYDAKKQGKNKILAGKKLIISE